MVIPKNTPRRPQCFSGGRKPRHTTADLGKNTMQMYRTSELSQNEKFSMRKPSSDYAWKIGYTKCTTDAKPSNATKTAKAF